MTVYVPTLAEFDMQDNKANQRKCDVCGTSLASHETAWIPEIGNSCTEYHQMWLEYIEGDERYDQYK